MKLVNLVKLASLVSFCETSTPSENNASFHFSQIINISEFQPLPSRESFANAIAFSMHPMINHY